RSSMPLPSTMFWSLTPWRRASASRSTKPSGSQYQLIRSAAAAIAATAFGEGPKALSLAPIRSSSGAPIRRSSASGGTKGAPAGTPQASGEHGGREPPTAMTRRSDLGVDVRALARAARRMRRRRGDLRRRFRLCVGRLLVLHAGLEGFDALGKIAHDIGDLA